MLRNLNYHHVHTFILFSFFVLCSIEILDSVVMLAWYSRVSLYATNFSTHQLLYYTYSNFIGWREPISSNLIGRYFCLLQFDWSRRLVKCEWILHQPRSCELNEITRRGSFLVSVSVCLSVCVFVWVCGFVGVCLCVWVSVCSVQSVRKLMTRKYRQLLWLQTISPRVTPM